ncbi:hypothetical protein LSAT2_003594 [Lamellibrachia satsuma]|nr:hypothetical protein LSAT2_003594 [Lamellibrachia satsuma]
MTPSQQTGASVSQPPSGMSMTPSQQTGVPVTQPPSSTGTSQKIKTQHAPHQMAAKTIAWRLHAQGILQSLAHAYVDSRPLEILIWAQHKCCVVLKYGHISMLIECQQLKTHRVTLQESPCLARRFTASRSPRCFVFFKLRAMDLKRP